MDNNLSYCRLTLTRQQKLRGWAATLFGILFCTASTFAPPVFAQADDLPAPQPYRAEYEARAMSMSTEAYRTLSMEADGSYYLRHGLDLSILGATLIEVEERSYFQWQNSGARPTEYAFEQGGIRKRQESVDFDWQSGTVNLRRDDNEQEIDAEPGMLDGLSFSAQLSAMVQQLDQQGKLASLSEAPIRLSFTIVDGRESEVHEYDIMAFEEVETTQGTMPALRVERWREPNSERSTILWLAVEYQYTLARLEQTESNGTTTTLSLVEIEFLDE
ncbi:MAG: DUF3108 domain-containing protein [Pseudohongiella nitratireducens]|nr:DUF3108 domain-containing protein [Pseudohongiella nitratireducens]